MPSNSRRRIPAIRVLAAVYAELGEEAFRGRYGRIAKLYGKDATLESVKSYFAEEVSKLAGELRARNLSNSNHNVHKRPQNIMSSPSGVEANSSDNDVLVTGERSIQTQCHPSHKEQAPDRRVSEAASDVVQISPRHSSTHREFITINRSETSRKRHYSSFQEDNDLSHSFAYMTNDGKYRCLLCKTEHSTAELLQQHETTNQKHQNNLKNPDAISQASIMLAQVYHVTNISCPCQHRRDAQSLMRGALRESMIQERLTVRDSPGIVISEIRPVSRAYRYDTVRENVQVIDEPSTEVVHSEQRTAVNERDYEHARSSVPAPASNIQTHHTPNAVESSSKISTQGVPMETRTTHTVAPSVTAEDPPASSTDIHKFGDVKSTKMAQFYLSRAMEVLAKQNGEEHHS